MQSDVLDLSVTQDYRYAGFGIRLLAAITDFVILLPVTAAVVYFTSFSPNYLATVFITLLAMLYKPVMESTYGATLGKMICKVRVIGADGQHIGMGEAWIRYVPWLLGGLLGLYVNYTLFNLPGFEDVDGFMAMGAFVQEQGGSIARLTNIQQMLSLLPLLSALLIFFNKQKQAAHDILAKSYVVHREETPRL